MPLEPANSPRYALRVFDTPFGIDKIEVRQGRRTLRVYHQDFRLEHATGEQEYHRADITDLYAIRSRKRLGNAFTEWLINAAGTSQAPALPFTDILAILKAQAVREAARPKPPPYLMFSTDLIQPSPEWEQLAALGLLCNETRTLCVLVPRLDELSARDVLATRSEALLACERIGKPAEQLKCLFG